MEGRGHTQGQRWMVGIGGMALGAILLIVVPHLKGISGVILLMGLIHLVGAIVVLRSGLEFAPAGLRALIFQPTAKTMKTYDWIMLAGLGLLIAAHGLVVWGGIKLSTKIGGRFPLIVTGPLMALGLYRVVRHIRGKRRGHLPLFSGGSVQERGEMERGPQGGFLLDLGHGFAEIAIVETDVPPRFRLYFHDKRRQARSVPRNATVKIETVRPGGARQAFGFQPKGDYLESTTEIPEPHEFNVIVHVSHGSYTRTHEVQFLRHDRPRSE